MSFSFCNSQCRRGDIAVIADRRDWLKHEVMLKEKIRASKAVSKKLMIYLLMA